MDDVTIQTPHSLGSSPFGETILSACDGLTYTQLLDNGYGLTPITPSNSSENSLVRTPVRSQSVKRRLVLEEGSIDDDGFRTPIKTPKRGRYSKSSCNQSISPTLPLRNVSPVKSSRYDTSLGKLTKEFVSLLQLASDGTVDLNKASDCLNVQKRRIYDITNVLEGIGLVNKKSKNNVQWTAKKQDSGQLKDSLDDLEAKENELDSLLESAEKDLLEISRDRRIAYVTYQDLHSIEEYKDNTIFAMKAPPGTQLQVPQDVAEQGYKIYMKSESSPIEVFLSGSKGVESSLMKEGDEVTGEENQSNTPSTPVKSITPGNHVFNTPKKEPISPLLDKFIKSEVVSSPESPFVRSSPTTSSTCDLNMYYDPIVSADNFVDADDLNSESKIPFSPSISKVGVDLFGPTTSPPPFLSLEPPLSDSDYTFSLDNTEGLGDLFDFNF